MEWYLKVIKNYATFSGRARRKEFWMFVLFNLIFSWGLTFIDMGVGFYDEETGLSILNNIYSLFVLIPGLAVSVRRLHDINKSGWWILIAIVPLVGAIWLIVLYASEGDSGENEYGKDPKGSEELELTDHLV